MNPVATLQRRELDARCAGAVFTSDDDGWDAARQAWNLAVDQCPETMEPWSTGGAYLNFAEVPAETRTAFPSETYQRLQSIRGQVDPDAIFQANHPIHAAA